MPFPIKIFSLLIIPILLVSCSKGDTMKIQISNKQKSLFSLITTVYSDVQLEEMSELNMNFEELNEQYPIQCVRQDRDDYRIVYRSEDAVLLIYFDQNGEKLVSEKRKLSKIKSDFDNVKEGQSIDEIKQLDDSGDYIFLYTGRIDVKKISSHYTCDGYLIQISYNDDLCVESVQTEFI